MDRRTLLRVLGTAAAGTVAGCGGPDPSDPSVTPPSASPPPDDVPPADGPGDRRTDGPPSSLADNYGSVVNVAAAGADTSGETPVDDVLASVAADNTLLYFPSGEYLLEDDFQFYSFSQFGMFGPEATLRPTEGSDGIVLALGALEEASRLHVEGFTFDFTASRTGGRPLVARVQDLVVARDLTVRGQQDVDQDMLRFDIADPEGQARVTRLRMPDGGDPRWSITGCEVGDDNAGDLLFEDCYIAGFPDNGLYADPPEGAVHVIGGRYENNDIANVRVNAGTESVVRGVHVRCDDPKEAFRNMRGIRIRGGNSTLVENCTVEMQAVTVSDGAITIASEVESVTVRDSVIRVDADNVNAIRIKSPDSSSESGDGPFRFRNLGITGTARTGAAIQAANRERCQFEGICIHQPGRDRDGIHADGVSGTVSDAVIAVTGRPLRFRNSRISTRDVRTSSSPASDSDSGPCS